MDIPASSLPEVRDTPVTRFYTEHTGVPDVLRNGITTEAVPLGQWRQWLERRVFKPLHLTSVKVDYSQQEGKDFYRISMRSPFRTVRMVVTPFAAFYFARMISYVGQQGALELGVDLVFAQATEQVLVPAWAVHPLMDQLVSIVKDHAVAVQFLAEEFHRLSHQQEEVEETGDTEVVPPVLH